MGEGSTKHVWFRYKPHWPVTCEICGKVLNEKNRDRDCKGPVKIGLREQAEHDKGGDDG